MKEGLSMIGKTFDSEEGKWYMIMIEVCEVRELFASGYMSGNQHEFCSGKLQLYT